MEDPGAFRRAYDKGSLDEAGIAANPFEQFEAWLVDASAAGHADVITEPYAMVLGTSDADGLPTSRTVLLRSLDARGFVFFTNYTSRKARAVADNPRASLLFPWYPLERQVLITGAVSKVSQEESDAYFRTRPRDSQIGAWVSHQSSVIAGREELDVRMTELTQRWPYPTPIPTPDFWGGFRVSPLTVEFWQGRTGRLHDRIRYSRATSNPDDTGWVIDRLAP